MFRVVVKQLWAARRRLVGTTLAVVLGVAFLTGTLVLGDTLQSNFSNLFAQASRGIDAVVRSDSGLDPGAGSPASARGLIPESLVGQIRATSGVAAAESSIQGYGRLLDRHGDPIGGNGPPTFAGNWVTDSKLNPYHLVAGRAPRAGNEVVINQGAADKGDLHVGDTTTVQLPQPVTVHIVGIAKFGSAGGLGGTTFTAFTLDAAQRLVTKRPGEVTTIAVRAAPGVSQPTLVRAIDRQLPKGTTAITGHQLVDENTSDVDATFLDFLRGFLLVFAGIALLVATFSIHNTFVIVIAQRLRESALLRAVGATARQVLVGVIGEALLLGAVASAIGLGVGVAIAGLLKGLFDAIGFALPAGGIVFTSSTVVIALTVGIVVTLVASIAPALHAARVAPVAALREGALDRSGASRVRLVVGAIVLALGALVTVAAATRGGGGVLLEAGLGAAATVMGTVMLGPVVVRPVCQALGRPVTWLRGVTGAMASSNATRNPRRTAGTAAALTIGVCVVTLFTVFATSLRASIDDTVSRSFRGDLVVNGAVFGRGGFSPQLARDVNRLPAVRSAVGLGRGIVRIGTTTEEVSVADAAPLAAIVDLDVRAGSMRTLGASSLAVSTSAASDHGWHVGDTVPVSFADGATVPLRIGALYANNDLVADVVVPRAAWAPHAAQDVDGSIFVVLRSGTPIATGKAEVQRAAAAYGHPDVLTRSEYTDQVAGRVNIMLGVVYVLLALAIVIALMGIGNTLSLSIYERRHELGLLRAVGETRAQVRSMVRWESVLVSSFGTVTGVALGVFLGWALVQAASTQGTLERFAAPAPQLAIIIVVGTIAGVLAAWRPARRAAQLNVLTALASE